MLAPELGELEVEAGTRIVSLDDYGTAIYFVEEGEAEAVPEAGEARRDVGPGDTFGEIALLVTGQRTATVIRERRCGLLSLSGEDFKRIRAEVPRFEGALRRLGNARAGR